MALAALLLTSACSGNEEAPVTEAAPPPGQAPGTGSGEDAGQDDAAGTEDGAGSSEDGAGQTLPSGDDGAWEEGGFRFLDTSIGDGRLYFSPVAESDIVPAEGDPNTEVLASPEFWVVAGPDGTVHEVGEAVPEWSPMGATCQDEVDVGLCVTAEQVNEPFTVHGNWPKDEQVTLERYAGEAPQDWREIEEMEPVETVSVQDIDGWSQDLVIPTFEADVEFSVEPDEGQLSEGGEALFVTASLPPESLEAIPAGASLTPSVFTLTTGDEGHTGYERAEIRDGCTDKSDFADGCRMKVPNDVVDSNVNWDMPFRFVLSANQDREGEMHHTTVTTLDEVMGTDSSDFEAGGEVTEQDFEFTRSGGEGLTITVTGPEDLPVRLGDATVVLDAEEQTGYQAASTNCDGGDFRAGCSVSIDTEDVDAPVTIDVTVRDGVLTEDVILEFTTEVP